VGSSSSSTDRMRIVALPPWKGLSETKQTLLPPREPGGPLKISIDLEPHAFGRESIVRPLIIDRSLDLIIKVKKPDTGAVGHLQGLGRGFLEGLGLGISGEGKRKRADEMIGREGDGPQSFEDEMSQRKRR